VTNVTSTVEITSNALGGSLSVIAPEPLAHRLRQELAALWCEPGDHPVGEPRRLELELDGQPRDPTGMAPAATGVDAVQLALTEITRAVIVGSPLLCVHAGVVTARARDVSIVLPGVSGQGKTTLVAALIQRGFGYVSDEVLAIDRHTGELAGFSRPLALDRSSWDLLSLAPHRAPAPGAEQLAGPRDLGIDRFGGSRLAIAPVSDIVLIERGAPGVTFEPIERGAAVAALLGNSFNHFGDPAASFHSIVALIRGARVWRLRYNNAPAAADVLADRLSN
jgi:hypothetical protein